MTSSWLLAGWTMLHFLWIGTLIGVLNALGRFLLHRAAPSLRYAWSLFGFALLALAPAAIACALFETARSPIYSHVVTQSSLSPQPALTDIPHVLPIALDQPPPTALAAAPSLTPFVRILPALWLVGSPLTFTVLAFGLAGTERLRRSATLLTPDHPLAATATRLAHDLGRIRPFAVATSTRIASPLLLGILRPLILLPATAAGWPPDHLEMVLLHELAHLRRHDNLVNLLQRLVESALFFHPAIWISSRWLRIDRELCCDTLVVARTAQPRAYAELLLSLREASSLHVPAVAMSEGPLAQRVRHILQVEDPLMRLSRPSLALAATLLATPAVLLLRSAPAQEPKTPPSPDLAQILEPLVAPLTDGQRKCTALVSIARAQAKQGDTTGAAKTLSRAADTAAAPKQWFAVEPGQISTGISPATLLAEVAREQAALGDRETALANLKRAAKLAENPDASVPVPSLNPVANLAVEFRALGELDDARAMAVLADRQAEQIAAKREPITPLLFYIQDLAAAHTAAGDLDGAYAIVGRTVAGEGNPYYAKIALSNGIRGIDRALTGANVRTTARDLDEMLALINDPRLAPHDERLFALVIGRLCRIGDIDRANQLLAQTQGLGRAWALREIADEQRKRGDVAGARRSIQEAAEIVLSISSSRPVDGELSSLIEDQLQLGDFDTALRLAQSIAPEPRVANLALIAHAQRRAGDSAAAQATVHLALAQLDSLEAGNEGPSTPQVDHPIILSRTRKSFYRGLRIKVLASGSDLAAARALVDAMPADSPERFPAAFDVARELARTGQPAEAVRWTASLALKPNLQPMIATAILLGLADLP